MSTAESQLQTGWARPAVRDLVHARRRNRAARVDVFEGFYQAYLTAFGCGVAVLLGSDAVGDAKATSAQIAHVVAHGPGVIGFGAALIWFIALRSGSRGGPLVLPAADVRHVLLAPVPRRDALRPAAIRQVRFSAFVGMVAGAGVATVAARRFTGGVPSWAPLGAAAGVVVGASAAGIGMLTSGRRIPVWLANLMGLGLLGWSAADIALGRVTSPMALLGELALTPLKFRAPAVAIAALPVVLAVAGVAAIGGLSIEHAERRATLASQIRFALTLQDIRTVVLLRRQLTQEQARPRPWVKLGALAQGRTVVWRRDLRGLTRWPLVRVLRVLLLAAAAGAALVGTWAGTTPLLLVAALALFLAGLECLEPLAQDIDHPDIPSGTPVVAGEQRLRHAPVPLATMVVVALVAWGTALVMAAAGLAPVTLTLEVGGAMVLPAALLGTVAAAASIVMEPSAGGGDFLPAEIAGVKLVLRAIWSPLLAVLGLTPLLLARSALHQHMAPGPAAVSGSIFPLMAGVLGLGWLRFREDLHEYFKMPAATAQKP